MSSTRIGMTVGRSTTTPHSRGARYGQLTPEEFAEYLSRGYEGRGYEFKGAIAREDAVFFAKVTRAALGMANYSGGGVVFIGVDEGANHELVPTGLTDEQFQSWNFDDVAAGFAPAADPRLSIDLEVIEHLDRRFVAIIVHEFEEVPVLCRRNYNHGGKTILRDGALYVRGRGKPESTEVPSQTEMRELLDTAIDKGIRRFLARAGRVGLGAQQQVEPDAAAQFAAELEEPDA